MKKKFQFSNFKDISIRHVNFSEVKYYSLRNRLRDYYDKIIRRPVYSKLFKNFFKKQNYKIDLVLPAKGFSVLARREMLNNIHDIKNKTILNIGCGNAFDYHLWFKFKPKKIVGVDVLNYENSWLQVKKFAKKEKIDTKIEFYRKDFVKFKYKKKFDLIVSDAVFEHCKNLSKVIKNCNNLLKKNGVMYASYGGPMWFTYGGDHFSGRDKEQNGFNHLLLNKKNYQNYFDKNVKSLDYELNEGGGGGVLVQEDLFSKLKGDEYIKIFNKFNFKSLFTFAEFCPIGLKLIKNNITLKNKLKDKFPLLPIENYYLKTHIVYLQKK
ncbi:class I SAM-dependent methyltransferase [Candidatus Pelagibacter sp.]|nr:class I SAM-dependent methyltransferase [Candidatus Pelagibacter sp.]